MMKSNDLSKSAIIIQSRMSSQRFKGKMMAPIFGEIPLVEYIAKRCQRSNVKNILVATSDESSDDVIVEQCQKNDIPVMQGDLNNVLRRYVQTAEYLNAEYVVRLCGYMYQNHLEVCCQCHLPKTYLVDFSILFQTNLYRPAIFHQYDIEYLLF